MLSHAATKQHSGQIIELRPAPLTPISNAAAAQSGGWLYLVEDGKIKTEQIVFYVGQG